MLALQIVVLMAMIDSYESCTTICGTGDDLSGQISCGSGDQYGRKKRSSEKDGIVGTLTYIETLAFHECESDGNFGLTWNEVKICEKKFAHLYDLLNLPIPTKEGFKHFDTNHDGILTFDEWKNQSQIDESE